MNLPEAILFDADGTLYESERIGYEASRLTALELHDFELSWETFEAAVIRGTQNTHELLASYGLVVDPEQVQQRKRHHYQRIVAEELQPMPGLMDFLPWCRQQDIACFVISVNRRAALDAALAALSITDYFEDVISMEVLGDKVKPDPFPYEFGLQLAGVAVHNAIAIEDTHKGLTSAKAAGLFCVGMRNDINDDQELRLADYVISDYRELRAYLASR
jgi:beta-phosphoglucomutase